MKNKIIATLVAFGLVGSASAIEINDNLSINGFIDGSVNKVDAKKFVSDFEPIWLGDFFNPDIKAHVYATVNLMGEKHLKAYPDYKNYFSAIYHFASSGKTPKNFEDWQSTLDRVLNGRDKKRMSNYLKTSKFLFSAK